MMNGCESSNFVFPGEYKTLNELFNEENQRVLEVKLQKNPIHVNCESIHLVNPADHFGVFHDSSIRPSIPLPSILGSEEPENFGGLIGSALVREEDMNAIRQRYRDCTDVLVTSPSGFGKTHRLLLLGCNNVSGYFSIYVSCGGGVGFSNSFDQIDEFNIFWKHFEGMNRLEDDEISLYKNTEIGRDKTKEFLIFRLCHLCYLIQREIVKTPREFMISQFDRNGRNFLAGLKLEFDRFIVEDIGNFGKLEKDVRSLCSRKKIQVDFMVDEINVLWQRFTEKCFSKYLENESPDTPPTPPKGDHVQLLSTRSTKIRKRPFLYPFLFQLSKEIRSSSVFQKLYVSGTLLSYNIIEAFVSSVGKRRITQIYFEHDFDVNESFDQVKSDLSEFLSISEPSFEEMKTCLERKNCLEKTIGRKRIIEKIISKIHSRMIAGDIPSLATDREKGNFLAIAAEEALDEYTKEFIESFQKDKLTSPHVKALLSLLGNLFHTKQISLPYRLCVEGKGEYDFMTSAFAQLSQSNQNRRKILPEMETIEWEIVEQVVIDALVSYEIRGNAQISPRWTENCEINFLWSFVNEWKKGSMGFIHEEFFIEKFCERWKGASLGEIFNGKISKFSDEGEFERLDNCELSGAFWPLLFDVANSRLVKHEKKIQEIEYLKKGDLAGDEVVTLPHVFVSPTTFHHCDGLIGIIQDYEEENGKSYFFDLRIGLKLGLNMVGIRELRKNVCQTSLDSSYCKIGGTIVSNKSHFEIGDVLDSHRDAYEAHKKWVKSLDFSIRMHVDLLKYNKRGYRSDLTCWNDLHCVGTVEDEDEEKVEVKDTFEEYFVFVDEDNIRDFIDEKYLFVFELMRSIRDVGKVNRLDIPRSIIDYLGPRTVGQGHGRKMGDEESETKVFNLFSYIENPNGGLSEITFKFNTWEGLVNHLFEKLGRGNENEVYKIYDEKWKHLTEVDQVMKRPEMSTLYFVTKKQKQLKEEEEARKLKEEEEARKLKGKNQVRIFFVSEKNKLVHVAIDLEDDQEKFIEMDYERSKDYVVMFDSFSLQRKNFVKKDLNFYMYTSVNSEISGTWDWEVVGIDMRTHDDFGKKKNEFSSHFLNGHICFLLGEEEKDSINELYQLQQSNRRGKREQEGIDISKLRSFRAGSGMSFLDKWFDDDDEKDGRGAISGSRMKDEDSAAWKKEILLECSDGGIVRKNMDNLLQKSRFFRMMMSFNGKEAHEAREHGKIKIEFLSTLEMEYYLKIIFGMVEEDKGGNIGETGENSWIRLLLRMLEFGMRYQERKVAEKVLTELEMHIIPDLISCGTLDLKFLELGHLLYDRLPNGLLEELLERWCLDFDVRKTSIELRRLIHYSSTVMGKACTFFEEKDMLDEDAERYDYGVGEVVLGNGKVLEQCFVGEFGGQVMIWSDSNHENNDSGISTSFVGCLNGSTSERSLFKIKRRRDEEEEDDKSLGCVGDGKARKLMSLDEVESFLLE